MSFTEVPGVPGVTVDERGELGNGLLRLDNHGRKNVVINNTEWPVAHLVLKAFHTGPVPPKSYVIHLQQEGNDGWDSLEFSDIPEYPEDKEFQA